MSPGPPVRLQTSVWNPMGARRALLLHGLGSDSSSWWRIASELADQGCMVLAPDLRSHGRSPTSVDHRMETLVEDVLLLGEAYDVVVGHSLGGAVAAALLTRPCFSAAAVLIDPILVVADDERASVRRELRDEVGVLDPAAVRAARPRWTDRDVELKVLAARQVAPSVVDAVLDDNDPWDLVSTAEHWQGRVHVLAADPDLGSMLDAATLERVVAGPKVTGQLVEGAGHSIHRERPELVLEVVRKLADL